MIFLPLVRSRGRKTVESEVILHKLKKKKRTVSLTLHSHATDIHTYKKKGGDWERKEAEQKPPHGCHDWPIRNSTSQITWDTREFISGDTEMSSSRDSYKVNSEWFSSTLARACRALAARRIMSTLVGSN